MKRTLSILLCVLLQLGFAMEAGAQMKKLPKKVDRIKVHKYTYKCPVSPQMLADYLSKHLVIPNMDTTQAMPGVMTAYFVIDTLGKVRNPNIVTRSKGSNASKVQRAILTMLKEMPPWPVAQTESEGKVPVKYELPVNIDWGNGGQYSSE